MCILPCLELIKPAVDENLQELEELVVFEGEDGVELEKRIKVEESGEGEGGDDEIDGCVLRIGGRGFEGADVGEFVLVRYVSARLIGQI